VDTGEDLSYEKSHQPANQDVRHAPHSGFQRSHDQNDVKYSVVKTTLENIVIPRTASARDVINAWWVAVERDNITDLNIMCLSRDPEAFDIQDENGDQVEIDDGVEGFLKLLNRTSPEVVQVDITWDGHDKSGQSFRLTASERVHREAQRSRLLAIWIRVHKAKPAWEEVPLYLFTDENEYYWTDDSGAKTAPPWRPGQQVIFKLKPWS
jgi:hypothetical protein